MSTSVAAENPLAEPVVEPAARKDALRWRDALFAFSLANFCFVQSWYGLLFQVQFGYYNRIPVNRPSLAALLINIFLAGLLIWLAAGLCRRWNRRGLWLAASVAVCLLTLVPLNFARTYYSKFTAAKLAALWQEPWAIVLGAVLVAAAIWFHRPISRGIAMSYIILSPMLLFTVGKAAWWLLRPPPAPAENIAPMTAAKQAQPRVVWILLDELDQRIGFEARPPQVQMPELARFYDECFRATNAFPPAGYTRLSVAALTIGREVRSAKVISASELALAPNLPVWSATENVFSRARALGFTTALAGWCHPYGRVLGRHLDRCVWTPYPPYEEERGATLGAAMLNQLCAMASQFQQRRLHIQGFKTLQAASLEFLTNSPAGLTFLHLPVPHLPGIYDARRERFTLCSYSRGQEYLGNLALADRLFGTLRRAMEEAGTWENTWILLSSDHWWREAPQVDHRVPLIIKGPGQNEPVTYGRSLNTLMSYHLVLAVLKGELKSSSQLPDWFDRHRIDPPGSYQPLTGAH